MGDISPVDYCDHEADVVVRGYSGYNTRWALKVIERVFPASEEHGGSGDVAASPLAVTVDGLHLTRNGNKIVFEEVVKRLEEEGLSPEKLPADLPLFQEIDSNNPLKAFEGL
ncbi:unnamed protein product [Citrullus colocynthis]|uniref:Uncharacterized protein n=1 Tax=Citrullus colocynthis TaxID=252529 RepID=A0ABP0YMD7_9ROSI